ncbi:hypothetical protein Hanom_Chr03g00182091 [Helianthus anomalus]
MDIIEGHSFSSVYKDFLYYTFCIEMDKFGIVMDVIALIISFFTSTYIFKYISVNYE